MDCEPCRFALEDVEGRVEGGDDIRRRTDHLLIRAFSCSG